MRQDYRFQIEIKLLSPVISQAQQGTQLGVDTEAWQIKKQGKVYAALPGSLIRGNLRHSWLKLAELSNDWITQTEIEEYLGQAAKKANASDKNEPQRAWLRSSDNWIAEEETQSTTLHRIKKDEKTGGVGKGMLQTLTAPHPVGREVVYRGWFEITCEESKLADLKHKLEKGLGFIPALGAFKGVGFGRVLNIEVSEATQTNVDAELQTAELDEQFSLELSFDRPICFAKAHPEVSNRFESGLYIPGGAIKGAIATRIKQLDHPRFAVLEEQLSLIRITHAHPCLADAKHKKRASVIPLSLYYADKNKQDICFDASSESQETTIKRHNIRFKEDWKEVNRQAVAASFSGLTDSQLPQRILRVRTAIDSETDASKDEALFSIDALKTDKHVWLGNISLAKVAEEKRDAVKQALQELLAQGLNSLGKTRAQTTKINITKPLSFTLEHEKIESLSKPLSMPLAKGDQIRILLQSDSVLFDKDNAIPASNAASQLKKVYETSWRKLSDNSLQLSQYFAKQGLYGGDYYWRRFRPQDEIYHPLLLTKAGSLFVLEVIEPETALEKIKQWQQQGISLLPEAKNDWKENPLLANNGYGEVSINPRLADICKKISTSLKSSKVEAKK